MADGTEDRWGGTPRADGYLEQLIAAINENARTARTAMTTLLAVIVYLGAVCLAADHEALLRADPTNLPQVGTKLPLVASFILAPPVLLFLHLTLLIQLDLLAPKLRAFRDELAKIPLEARRRPYRLLIFPFAFAQAHLDGWHLSHWPMRLMSWFAIVGLPLAMFVLVLVRFLPYQDEYITRSHQIWVVIDCLILWFFQIRRHPYPTRLDRQSKAPLSVREDRYILHRCCLLPGLALLLGVVIFQQARIPEAGEGNVRRAPNVKSANTANILDWACANSDFGCRYLKLANRTLLLREAPRAFLSKYDEDDAKRNAALERYAEGLVLRGRTLRYADLANSELYRADLIDADLRSARLTGTGFQGAQLQEAVLGCKESKIPRSPSGTANAGFFCNKAEAANLAGASLQGANLVFASLQGTTLAHASLQGATLAHASLQGTTLAHASLQGANLFRASLQGANLTGASLQGANLGGASLQAANLYRASLQGANLTGASLQGANLAGASLQAANLSFASLQGANLFRASLQGADLGGASLDLADLRNFRVIPIPDTEMAALNQTLSAIVMNKDRLGNILDRLKRGARARPAGPDGMTQSEAHTEIFSTESGLSPGRGWHTPVHGNDPARYAEMLVPFLTTLACKEPDSAKGLAGRASPDAYARQLFRLQPVPGLAGGLLNAPCFKDLDLPVATVEALKKEHASQQAEAAGKTPASR